MARDNRSSSGSVGGPSIRDFIDSRDDIRHLRDIYKEIKNERNDVSSIRDLLPLTPGNDLGYVRPSDLDRAEWFAKVWEEEGRPEIHPRGMHYRILGKGYDRPRTDEPYVNDTKSWGDMADGAFYAQVLGLVDPDMILDEKNPDPTVVVSPDDETTWENYQELFGIGPPQTGYSSPNIPTDWEGIEKPELNYEDAQELIDEEASRIGQRIRRQLTYDALKQQGRYVEIWAEKSGVIPEDVAREYGAVIRPAGGGEMSYNMVRDAVKRAKDRGQDLAIVIISDFDPKGRDMPKSVARKVEVEAALEGIDAEVHHGAVTKEQVADHALPGDPAKTPEGSGSGAKAYETHKAMFRDYAGQHPVEIQAFSGREEAAFAAEIEKFVEPYHDPNMGRKVRQAIREFANEVEQEVREIMEEHEDEIQEHLDAAQDTLENYLEDVGETFDDAIEVMEELQESHREATQEHELDDTVFEFEQRLHEIDFQDIADEMDPDLPVGDIDWDDLPTPLLDTQRTLSEQLSHYHDFDIRRQ